MEKTAVTIGKFDGLHIGHQKLISRMTENAKKYNLKTVVFSFFPPPAAIITGEAVKGIYSREEKRALVEASGADSYIEYDFMELADMPPEAFVKEILSEKLRCGMLIVGEGFRFGKNKTGDNTMLGSVCADMGMKLVTVSPIAGPDGNLVSSSRIRERITSCDFSGAREMLGRPYYISGIVKHGKKIGRGFGFPTVNVPVPPDKFTPKNGVYVSGVLYDGKQYPGVTNIGVNPTVSGGAIKCESFIFDFDKIIYNEKITVNFYEYIRDEMSFDSIERLRGQIAEDTRAAMEYWNANGFIHDNEIIL